MKQSLISLFQSALISPEDHFKTLSNKIDSSLTESIFVDWCGMFAEVKIYIYGRGYAILYMPLTEFRLEISAELMRDDSYILSPYLLLKDELRFYDSNGNQHTLDLMLQYIKGGVPLAYSSLDTEQSLAVVSELESECQRIGFSHNHLTLYDIMLSPENRPYLIRYHYATFNGAHDNFDAVRTALTISGNNLLDTSVHYDSEQDQLISEGCSELVCYRKNNQYGYKDREGNIVLRAKYRWAGDFYEQRAVVKTASGYGVIDLSGNFIVEPIHDMLYYNLYHTIFYNVHIVADNDSRSRSRQHTKPPIYEIYGFDYNGTALKPTDPRLQELLDNHMKSVFKDKSSL